MNTEQKIRFKHRMNKFHDVPNRSPVKLIRMERVFVNDLPVSFIEYDTRFGYQYYEMESMDCILLTFLYNESKIFTTLRTYNFSNWKMYENTMDEDFMLFIEEES